jgi:hypothetical protein
MANLPTVTAGPAFPGTSLGSDEPPVVPAEVVGLGVDAGVVLLWATGQKVVFSSTTAVEVTLTEVSTAVVLSPVAVMV